MTISDRAWFWAGLGCALVVAMLFLRPLFGVGLPVTDDGLNHVQRLVAFDDLIRSGVLYPRWYPDFATGYGYPLGNYYPPLALYVAELPMLAGLAAVAAVQIATAIGCIAAAIGAYLLCRQASGSSLGGAIGSAVYLAAPYAVFDVYQRGALPEYLAMAILPWCLWSLGRWNGGRAGLLLASLPLAGLVLAHSVIAFIGWPLAATWWLARRQQFQPRDLALVLAPFALGAGLSAFYWLPAAAEANLVALDNFRGLTTENLHSIGDIAATSIPFVYSQFLHRLGLGQLAASALGVAGVLLGWPHQRKTSDRPSLRSPLLLLAWLVVFVGGASSIAGPLWSSIRLLDPIQFPWRLLAPAALCTGMLASYLAVGGDRSERRAQQSAPPSWRSPFRLSTIRQMSLARLALASAVIVFVTWDGLARIEPKPLEIDGGRLDLAAVVRREFSEGTIGTTTAAEYLPATVRAIYRPDSLQPLSADTSGSDPDFQEVTLLQFGRLGTRLRVGAEVTTPLRLHAFWFPGWKATIDGQSVPVYPSEPYGLVTVQVPAGSHEVVVEFADTPVRTIAWLIAVASLIIGLATLGPVLGGLTFAALAILLALIVFKSSTPESSTLQTIRLDRGPRLVGGNAVANDAGLVRLDLFWQATESGAPDLPLTVRLLGQSGNVIGERSGRAIWATSSTAAWQKNELVHDVRVLRIPPGEPRGLYGIEVSHGPQSAGVKVGEVRGSPARPANPPAVRLGRFGDAITLDGYEVSGLGPGGALPAGKNVDVRLMWTAARDIPEDYTVFVHLIGPDGQLVAQHDGPPAGGAAPTAAWVPGDRISDRHRLTVPASATQGRYEIRVGLYLPKTLERLESVGGATTATLGPFKVSGPANPPPPSVTVNTRFAETIELVGYDVEDTERTIVLTWRALRNPPADYTVFVHQVGETGTIVGQVDSPPLRGGYPTSLWSAGEVVRDRIALPSTAGRILIGLYDRASGARLATDQGDSVAIQVGPSR